MPRTLPSPRSPGVESTPTLPATARSRLARLSPTAYSLQPDSLSPWTSTPSPASSTSRTTPRSSCTSPTASAASRNTPAASPSSKRPTRRTSTSSPSEGVCGGSIPVAPGIAPGSGPGHLGLFGYDPLQYLIGRGALEATGIGFKLEPGDVAIRANFCTVDAAGLITDRRAGRIPTEESAPLAIKLREVKIPNIEIFVEPVKEHRFVIVLRGRPHAGKLGDHVHDTDPQAHRRPAARPRRRRPRQRSTAEVAKEFVAQARKLLAGQQKANCLTLRGFAGKPNLPSYEEVYGLRAAAIAVYPMYKGLAQLVGMDVVGNAKTLDEQMTAARSKTGRSTTSSSSTSNTPTAPAKTATSPPR